MSSDTLDEELEFMVTQLNESIESGETESMTDALCDVSYSLSMTDEDMEEVILLTESVFLLSGADLIKDDGPLSFRNLVASYNVYPPMLMLNNQVADTSFTVFVESREQRKVRIEIRHGEVECVTHAEFEEEDD